MAELRHAEDAWTESHLLENLVNPSRQENLVMTSLYERLSVQTLREGEWSLKVTLTGQFKNAMFSWQDF